MYKIIIIGNANTLNNTINNIDININKYLVLLSAHFRLLNLSENKGISKTKHIDIITLNDSNT